MAKDFVRHSPAYVDGSAIGSVSYKGIRLLFDATHKVEIGTNTRIDGEWFDGAIDEVAVYGYALNGRPDRRALRDRNRKLIAASSLGR
jgi:hypothetical protein